MEKIGTKLQFNSIGYHFTPKHMDKHRYRQAFEQSTSKLCQEEFQISLHWLNSPIAIPPTKQ